MFSEMQYSRRVAVLAVGVLLLSSPRPMAAQEEPPEPPPVVWRGWSEAVFDEALERHMGVLLTVVHPWCRPCETADREVYTDPIIRARMARSWIPVRVDANERPDLDSRYRIALSVLGRGKSGYPVTAFLFPTGEAMWVDTFIPAEDREARPGLRALLESMDRFWKLRFSEAQSNAVAVQGTFDKEGGERRPDTADPVLVSATIDNIARQVDIENGGFGSAPRRQNPFEAELILLAAKRRSDAGLHEQAINALLGPVRGALYDWIDGGFHRATRVDDWSVPWFGKDLEVNAAYLHALAEAVRAGADPRLEEAASRTVDFILGTLKDPEGGFYAAQDPAGPGDEESDHYAWDVESLLPALGEENRRWAGLLFGLKEGGELHLGLPARFTLKEAPGAAAAAAAGGLGEAEIQAKRAEIVGILKSLRAAKAPPPVQKVRYLDATSAACRALLAASEALGRADAAAAALGALDAVLDSSSPDDGIPHALHAPEGSPVLMSDQALFGNALIDAHEHTGERKYLDAAVRIGKTLLDLYDSPDGAFYDVIRQDDAAGYIRLRRKPTLDESSMSPLVVAATLLYRIGHHTDSDAMVRRAQSAFDYGSTRLPRLDEAGTTLALAVDAMLSGPVVISVGPAGTAGSGLREAALALYEPGRILKLKGRNGPPGGGATVCVAERCREDVSSSGEMATAIAELRRQRALESAAGQPSE
jgi:hypothetical protein